MRPCGRNLATSWYKPGTRQEVAVPDHDLCTLLAPAAHATAPEPGDV